MDKKIEEQLIYIFWQQITKKNKGNAQQALFLLEDLESSFPDPSKWDLVYNLD